MNQAQPDIANQLAPAYLTGKNVAQSVSAAASQANNDLASVGHYPPTCTHATGAAATRRRANR